VNPILKSNHPAVKPNPFILGGGPTGHEPFLSFRVTRDDRLLKNNPISLGRNGRIFQEGEFLSKYGLKFSGNGHSWKSSDVFFKRADFPAKSSP